MVYIIIHFFQSFSTRQNPCTKAASSKAESAVRTGRIFFAFNLACWDTNVADFKTKVRLQAVCSEQINRGRTLQACQNRKRFCPAQMTSLTFFNSLISLLTKDDWLLHLFIYSFRLFEFDWFFCRCSLATVIELQWSNISFILAQESLLEVFVSTLKLGMAMFQWGWRYMAVKKVCKVFIFHHSLSMRLYRGTPCRELCQTQACDF